jgi:hypothetical protein
MRLASSARGGAESAPGLPAYAYLARVRLRFNADARPIVGFLEYGRLA